MAIFLPQLRGTQRSIQFIDSFPGYNHNRRINDGEMYDERNLCSDLYPILATRKERGLVRTLHQPGGLLAKDNLVWIEGPYVYYGEDRITGIQLSVSDDMYPKMPVSMGAYVCIWPDKVYFNTVDFSDCGYMYADFSLPDQASVSVYLCRNDGSPYSSGEYIASVNPPDNPVNGQLWIDMSGETHVLKQWNTVTAEWVDVATVFLRLEYPGIGTQFKQYDGINISGMVGDSEFSPAIRKQVEAINGSKLIYARDDDWICIAGLIDQTVSVTGVAGTPIQVKRKVPDLDYITECDNRLWGCKYGLSDTGETLNEIRCCALGDFRNWEKFMGISTDSYVVSCGTDGKWTGAGTLKGSPIFFKEGCLHRISGYSPSTFQSVVTMCRGVQDGSWRSICVVGEQLVYKSRTHVMTYSGSVPSEASYKLGDEVYYDACAGSYGNKYYISMRDASHQWHLFVYDSRYRTWHHQDELHVEAFAAVDDELYALTAPDDDQNGTLWALNGTTGELEDSTQMPWMATFGLLGLETQNQKYISNLVIRLQLEPGTRVDVEIQYDSDGEWHNEGSIYGKVLKTANIPVMPRRCDHCQLRLTGIGRCRIISIGRTYKDGGAQYAATI